MELVPQTSAQQLAQQLFNKAIEPIMDLPLTDAIIKTKGIKLARIILDEIYSRNTSPSKNDFYCDVNEALNENNITY